MNLNQRKMLLSLGIDDIKENCDVYGDGFYPKGSVDDLLESLSTKANKAFDKLEEFCENYDETFTTTSSELLGKVSEIIEQLKEDLF